MGKFEFNLGDKLRDKVTELEGICIGRIEYLNGCMQYAIKPKISADGKTADAEWVDSQQVVKVGDGLNAAVATKVKQERTGGPSSAAPRL